MTKFSFPLFLLFSFYNLFSQEQVSNIENIIKSDEYQKRFAVVDGKDYLIEDNDEFTKISIIEDNELKLIHNLNYRPKDEYRIVNTNYRCKTNNAVVYNEKYLVQFYTKSIYMIDIISGQLKKTIDLTDYANKILTTHIHFIGEEVLLQILDKNDEEKLVILNLETSEILNIDFEIKSPFFIIDDFLYDFRDDGLYRYNLKFKSTSLMLSSNSPIKDVKFYYIDCSIRLFFSAENKNYYIDNDHNLQQITCDIPTSTRTVYVNNNYLTINYKSNFDYYTKIIDLSNCNAIIDSLYIKDAYFYSIENLDDKYILASNSSYNIVSLGEHYLINTSTKEVLGIYSHSAELNPYNSYIINDKIFIGGWINSHYSTNRIDLHEIDLTSQNTKITTPYGPLNATNIQLGLSANQNIGYFIAQSLEGDSELYKIEDNTTTLIHGFNSDFNLGISNLSNIITNDNSFYYSTENGIYVTTDDITTKLASSLRTSDLVKYNNAIYTLIEKSSDEFGYLKIDLSNNNTTFKKNSYITRIENKKLYTPFGIIQSIVNANLKQGFFDFKTEKYETINFENKPLEIYEAFCSQKNILLKIYPNNEIDYYLFDSESKIVNKINLSPNSNYRVISLEDGSFLIENDNELYKLNGNGDLTKVIELPSDASYSFDEQYGLNGDVKTILYKTNNEILFISDKNNDYNITSIPYINPNASFELYWRKSDDIIIANTKVNGAYFTYQWRVGEEAKEIFNAGSDNKLYEVIFEGNVMVLFYQNARTKSIIIKHFDTNINEFVYTKEVNGNSYYSFIGQDNYKKYDDNKYYINYSDRQVGNELWSYDITNGDLTLVKDIYDGNIGSNPGNFIQLKDNIYFTATIRDEGIQWFKVSSLINSNTNVSEDDHILIAQPNPSNNEFRISIDLFDVHVTDSNGKSIYTTRKINSGESINLTIGAGIYFLNGKNINGKKYTAKLIKY